MGDTEPLLPLKKKKKCQRLKEANNTAFLFQKAALSFYEPLANANLPLGTRYCKRSRVTFFLEIK